MYFFQWFKSPAHDLLHFFIPFFGGAVARHFEAPWLLWVCLAVVVLWEVRDALWKIWWGKNNGGVTGHAAGMTFYKFCKPFPLWNKGPSWLKADPQGAQLFDALAGVAGCLGGWVI